MPVFSGNPMMGHGGTSERLAFLFLVGVLLFNAPLLSIFNVPDYVLGIPVLYVYLFAAWAVLIVLMALVIERAKDADEAQDPGGDPAGADKTD